jgi:aminobenzoyl-glutamate utilization protein B
MSIGHKNLVFAAKSMAASAIDLLTEPEIIKKAWDELNRRKKGREYKSPLPPGLKPPFKQFEAN